jgi:GTPase
MNPNEVNSEEKKPETFCGFVAIIGRPNVGKSTLLNKIIEQKISITSHKPQTTRHKILGIKTTGNAQVVYVDTPGVHEAGKHALNRYMNKTALAAMREVDLIVFVIEAPNWTKEDQFVLEKLSKIKCPVLLAVNKVDMIKPKEALLPYIEALQKKLTFAAVVPISASKNININELEREINKLLPLGEFLYSTEQITDRDVKFLAAEIIREKITKLLAQELPYASTVVVDQFKEKGKILHISATIFVEREGQKLIVIGKNGEQLKTIGTYARQDMETLFKKKVFLQLWVKIKSEWSNDAKTLERMGYL